MKAFTNCELARMRKVSESTVARLSMYLRRLEEVEGEGLRTLSSGELARRCGTTGAQVRKDLSFFGTFGKRGLGYSVSELTHALRQILGLERHWRVVLVGVGKIGSALLGYEDFRRKGFEVERAYDADERKVGQVRSGVRVRPMREMESDLKREHVDIAIVAVPAEAAQDVVDRVVSAGVRAILNFAPVKLEVPSGVTVKSVNMAMELEGLSYALTNTGKRSRRTNPRGT